MNNKEQFVDLIQGLSANKKNIAFLMKRRKCSLLVDNRNFITYKKENKTNQDNNPELHKIEIGKFFYTVRKAIDRYIIENNYSLKKVGAESTSTKMFNQKVFNELETGRYFILFDLNNAYWQMMYRQGIINEDVYLKYRGDYRYRTLKQIAIGLVNAPKQGRYMTNGTMIKNIDGTEFTVTEDNSQWKTVYHNVRVSCYNVPVLISNLLDGDYIYRNQDAIAVSFDRQEEVANFLRTNNYEFKMQICQKLSDCNYKQGKDLKKIGSSI